MTHVAQSVTQFDILAGPTELPLVKSSCRGEGLFPDRTDSRPEMGCPLRAVLMDITVQQVAIFAGEAMALRVAIVGANDGDTWRVAHEMRRHPFQSIRGDGHIGIDKNKDVAVCPCSPQVARCAGSHIGPDYDHLNTLSRCSHN
ncbi:MAG: hypothetical protein A4E19_12470 [Nitrospira sp. SG-bin1]|nr:MAG: hypothetical protein A4E19_12470 [Nitrospira sp. SG-bin1]